MCNTNGQMVSQADPTIQKKPAGPMTTMSTNFEASPEKTSQYSLKT